MLLSDFDFKLPENLIAQHPLKERTASRLLCLNRKNSVIEHKSFTDFFDLLMPHDLLVFNDTRVLPARLLAQKETGAKVEILLERILTADTFLAHLAANHTLKIGTKIILGDKKNIILEIIKRQDELFVLRTLTEKPETIFKQFGLVPLPPYIERHPEVSDQERYQTVYAKNLGAVAAPTAGLHFDNALLKKIADKGVASVFITLHVASGTFKPVKAENILEHKMHHEYFAVSEEVCNKVNWTKKRGGRIIAIGTTAVRALEAAASDGILKPMVGDTNIFIYPGINFKVVDVLLTNFHLPKSTLLMLVSAFAGRENILNAYQEAIREQYRFFSYGDAMYIF